EGRANARDLAGALLRARGKAGHAPRQPSQKPETGEAERDGDVEPPAHPEQPGGGERTQPAAGFEHHGGGLRVDLGEGIERPQRQRQHHQAENDRGHYGLICSSSLIAPVWRRAERSASARMPPAADAAAARNSSASSWAAPGSKRQ